MDKRENLNEIDLLQLTRALWRRIGIIIISVVLCGALAFSYAFFLITPKYTASAMMYVNNSSFSVGSTSVSLADLNAAKSLVDTYIVILKSRTTMNEVIKQADLKYSYEEMYEMVSAAPVGSTEIFTISVTGNYPWECEKIANTITEILPDKISDIVDGSSVRIVDHAVVPTVKSSPSLSRYTALGMLLGAVLSCGAIILAELLDDQIHGEDYLRKTYDLPILAAIPDLTSTAATGNDYYRTYGRQNYSSKGVTR